MHWTHELLKLHDAWMLRALIKYLLCEVGEGRAGRRHTKSQTKPQMKYKTGEAEFKVNFIQGQISSSAQGWGNACSSIFSGCWDLASCNSTTGLFWIAALVQRYLRWSESIQNKMDTGHSPVSKSLCLPLAHHCLAPPQGRTGLHLCLLCTAAGVAAQHPGTALWTTPCGT